MYSRSQQIREGKHGLENIRRCFPTGNARSVGYSKLNRNYGRGSSVSLVTCNASHASHAWMEQHVHKTIQILDNL